MTRPETDPDRQTVMDKTLLAAFADGVLEPEEAARVVLHLADHPGDQAYVDEVMAANAALQQAFAAPLAEPVPPRIRAAILGDAPASNVVPLVRPRRAMAWGLVGLAAAAALATVAVLGPLAPTAPGAQLAVGPVPAASELGTLLAAAPSGTVQDAGAGRSLTVLATLPTAAGFCREVELIDRPAATLARALACTEGPGWRVAVVVAEGMTETATGIAPATGGAGADLTPWLDSLGAGLVLDAQGEAQAMARGWR